jgi:copper(I)-binding protein
MKLVPAAAALVVIAACSPAQTLPAYTVGNVDVAAPFSRPAPAGGNGAGFFTLTNRNAGGDVLIAVESPIARRIEIHESSVVNGMMQMRELPAGVPMKAGESVAFKPGGKHVMFIGLNQALKAGDRIPVTLVLKRAGRVPVEFTVQGRAATGGGEHEGH